MVRINKAASPLVLPHHERLTPHYFPFPLQRQAGLCVLLVQNTIHTYLGNEILINSPPTIIQDFTTAELPEPGVFPSAVLGHLILSPVGTRRPVYSSRDKSTSPIAIKELEYSDSAAFNSIEADIIRHTKQPARQPNCIPSEPPPSAPSTVPAV